MFLLINRTLILYFITLLAVKLMGKRQIGELQPFDLVVLLIISEMASVAMQSTGTPLIHSVVPIFTMTILQIMLALLNLKSEKSRDIFCGVPSIIIKKGELQEEEMRRLRLSLSDLLEQLRFQGYFDISQIEYVFMETNGNISIMPKSSKRPLETGDISLKVPLDEPAWEVILDGKIQPEGLQQKNLEEKWLLQELGKMGVKSPKDVFIATIGQQNQVFCQLKDNAKQPVH